MFLASAICQMFPGAPTYTEKNIADLTGKVYVVTGANTGIGKLVAQTLYQKNATVWVAARNEDKATQAIASIRDSCPGSAGALKFLHLDLSDLVAVKRAAETFLAGGTRLDVLFNNAGVMIPPADSVTAQGYELQLGTNCLGHFLLAKLLTPRLVETAKSAPKDSVRVVWLSSSAAELLTIGAGVNIDNLDYHQPVLYPFKYGTSKAGNYLQATEYARRYKEDGVVSVSVNPGNLETDLDRHANRLEIVYRKLTVYPAIYGAYTELFAGLSGEVTVERFANSGEWIVPWGRITKIKASLERSTKPEQEGGTGIAQKFWDWCEEQTKAYM